jgi:hypothetical protein
MSALVPATHAARVVDEANDLSGIVDASQRGAADRRGIVDRGEGATAEEIAMLIAGAVDIRPDDLSGVVDAGCSGALGP